MRHPLAKRVAMGDAVENDPVWGRAAEGGEGESDGLARISYRGVGGCSGGAGDARRGEGRERAAGPGDQRGLVCAAGLVPTGWARALRQLQRGGGVQHLPEHAPVNSMVALTNGWHSRSETTRRTTGGV